MTRPRFISGASMAGVVFGVLLIFGIDIDSYQRNAFVIAAALALLAGGTSLYLSTCESTDRPPGRWFGWLDRSQGWWADWLGGISTELIGALVTTVLLSTLVEQAQLKDNLLAQLHSGIEENAIHALEELRVNGWLEDDTLRGASMLGVSWSNGDLHAADLREINLAFAHLENVDLQGAFLQRSTLRQAALNGANLSEADLQDANLSEADMQNATALDANFRMANLFWARLHGTNLSRATLTDAILVGAILDHAIMEQAILRDADLTGGSLYRANLVMADLHDAVLDSANMQGAVLLDANLEGADLTDVLFDENTVLPDGTRWAEGDDLSRFTDRSHDAFWRSSNPDSPAVGD